uniref:Uncharacterized protein n=1 Tax=Rhabditophanes sp. KR3021 TaxID=114890 RepID=A0AC35UEE2_9BILA
MVAINENGTDVSLWELPEKFLGTFKSKESVNFDAFLRIREIPTIIRKALKYITFCKKIEKNDDGTYNISTSVFGSSYKCRRITFNRPSVMCSKDGSKRIITFYYDVTSDSLVEVMQFENGCFKLQLSYYYFDGETLVWKCCAQNVSAKRFYKRVD